MVKKIIFLGLFLVACSSQPVDYSNILVSEVIDGDTVRLSNGLSLRYIGIDTPEVRIKKGASFVYEPQPFALAAKQYNQKLVEGKLIRVEFDVEKKDKYGRLLGYCFLGDTFINAELVKEGLAVLYTYPPNVKYVEQLVSFQKQARREGRGLWGSYKVIDHSQADQYIGQIRTVRGRVLSSYRSAKCLFLNFGTDYRTDFTVVIFNNSLGAFNQRGINPEIFYQNRLVEVSGRIREYNGPEIIVNTPYELQVIDEN